MMKILVLAPKWRYEAFGADHPALKQAELIFCDREGTEGEWLAAGGDAEAIFATDRKSVV